MLSALILSAAILGIPTGGPAPAAAWEDDPAIRIWLNSDGRYQRGDRANVQVKARDDGYLLVLHVDPDGRLRVLFPLDPDDDDFIRGGKKYEIADRGGRQAFTIEQRSGHGTVYAAISRDPFRFEGYVAGDHWDYAALDDVRISDKPEPDLNRFMQRIARSDFDYDILGYDVYESVVYGGPATGYGYGPAFYPSYFSGWGWGGTSLFIGLGFGHRHRFFRNPFFFDPFFFDPFFFNPFFFQPVFFVPVHHFHPFFGFPVRRPPFGGFFFATPWRPRSGGSTFTGGFQWRGREVATRTPLSGTLASAYRGRFNTGDGTGLAPVPRPARERGVTGPTPTGGRELAAATPTRRRSLDLTAGRTDPARPNRVGLTREPDRAPVGWRAVERSGSSAPLPQRVGPGEDNARGHRAEVPERPARVPNRVPEARPASPPTRDGSERRAAPVIRGDDRGGYEGARVMTQGAPVARRAEYDRPTPRPSVERGRMESSPGARGGSDGWRGRGGPEPRGEGWRGRRGGGTWDGAWRGRGGGGAWGGAWRGRGGRSGGMGVGGRHR
jgi:hypothetical protein